MASRKKKKRRAAKGEHKRTIGFYCAYCPRSRPRNERFVPYYYRPDPVHGIDPFMCYACFLERTIGKDRPGGLPSLTPETLAQFWREDVSDLPYRLAAAEYFGVDVPVIDSVAALLSP